MPRNALQKLLLVRINEIQEGNEKVVWISGKQITELFPRQNPSSVRMALLLLTDQGLVRRERRKGRGKKGRTGQSAWYSSINADPYADPTTFTRIRSKPGPKPGSKGKNPNVKKD